MMYTFIDRVIEEIKLLPVKDYSRVQIVFPTRRACVIFNHLFVKHFDTPQWMPNAASVEDFILRHSAFPIADDTILLMELFDAYKLFYVDEKFEDFYPWGKILLNDFDETDSNLVDQQKLFNTIQSFAELSNSFDYDEEQLKWIQDFWKTFFGDTLYDDNDIRNRFKQNWQHLPALYKIFREKLLEKKLVYRGLAYRLVAENLAVQHLSDEFDHIVFAGLYALSKSEEAIIRHLINSGKASLFWDADTYYTDFKMHEAGAYIRNNKLIEDEFKWKGNYFESTKKNISIYGVVQNAGQAKFLGDLLQQLIDGGKLIPEKTAIVLPDEQMLLPVLNSLPDQLRDINITMGYPLKQSNVYSLLMACLDVFNSQKISGKHVLYGKIQLLALVNHVYTRNWLVKNVPEFLNEFENLYSGYISSSILSSKYGSEIFNLLNTPPGEVLTVLINLLKLLFDFNEKDLNTIEREAFSSFLKTIKEQQDLFISTNSKLEDAEAILIIKDLVKNVRIPFSGEPVKGIQIIGFLETRVLDFDRVFILSVNEGFLPAQKSAKTYIPYSLRNAFGLQTSEHQDSISAYHFYRLLQRSSDVHLIYNSQAGASGGGEPSRFILQIENELKNFENISITTQNVSTPLVTHAEKNISVVKDEVMIEQLRSKYANEKPFSPSALIAYITCPLKFYFRYIAGIREPDTAEESIEGALFGTVLHRAMELVYADRKSINKNSIKEIIKHSETVVQQSLLEKFPPSESGLEGKNILMKKILEELVQQILKCDASRDSFEIVGVEEKMGFDLNIGSDKSVKIQGTIDRLEQDTDALRIVDYKTGKMEYVGVRADVFESIFTDNTYKEKFQLYMYAWLVWKNNPGKKIRASFYELKKMSDGMRHLKKDDEIILVEELTTFENRLVQLINEIFDSTIPFHQTEDLNQCGYCPFNMICNR